MDNKTFSEKNNVLFLSFIVFQESINFCYYFLVFVRLKKI